MSQDKKIHRMTKTTLKPFDPATFIGKGWSIESDTEAIPDGWRPKDVRVVPSATPLKDPTALGARALQYYWEHQDEIPEEWKNNIVFFDATVLRNPLGYRYSLYLYWSGVRWFWDYSWLDDDRYAHCVSACASLPSALGVSPQPLDALPLELDVLVTVAGKVYQGTVKMI